MAGLITIIKSSDGTFAGQLMSGNSVITSYTTADTISTVLWAGDDTTVLATPTASWTSATTGAYQVVFIPANTSSLPAGRYQLQTKVATSDGRTIVADLNNVDVLDTPGSTVAPTTYCTYADMVTYMDSLPLLKTSSSQSGFAEARGLARSEFEQILQNHYSGSQPVYGNVSFGGGYSFASGTSKWLQDQLDANLLMVKPSVKKINALLALAIVCEGQISTNQKDETNYQKIGAMFRKRAFNLIRSYVAEIDLQNDGYADVVIRCGLMDTR